MLHYKITFNILSWFVCMLPVVLIFSNALSDTIVVTSSLFFIYLSIKEKNYEWLKEIWFQTTLLIYLWLIITSFFAYDIELALSRSTPWIRFSVFAAALQYLFLKNRTNQKRILIITFISILYVGLEMFIEHFTVFSLYSRFIEEYLGYSGFNGGPERVSGPFKDAPKSGVYLSYFLLPVFLGMIKIIKDKFSNLFLLIFIFIFLIINIYLIYISGHRTSMLCFFISLFSIIFYFASRKKKLVTILIVTLFSFGTLAHTLNLPILDKLKNKHLIIGKTLFDLKNFSTSGYGALSITSFKMFKTHPITGIGLKNYRVACEKDIFLSEGHLNTDEYISPWSGFYDKKSNYIQATCSSHPHNLYLNWLAETGLFGFLFFITFIIAIGLKIFKYKEIIYANLICCGIFLTLIPKLIPMIPALSFFSNWNAICFWLLTGWLLSFLKKEKRKKKYL